MVYMVNNIDFNYQIQIKWSNIYIRKIWLVKKKKIMPLTWKSRKPNISKVHPKFWDVFYKGILNCPNIPRYLTSYINTKQMQ